MFQTGIVRLEFALLRPASSAACIRYHSLRTVAGRRPHLRAVSTMEARNGDLNNDSVLRKTSFIEADPAYSNISLSIPAAQDDPSIRSDYRPFLQHPEVSTSDWISKLELSTAHKLSQAELHRSGGERLRILVLYGSLRARSYSRLLSFEYARILWRLGCDVRVFDPRGLPVKDDVQHDHPKVQELRELSKWSDGHVWVSPEQHGNLVSGRQGQFQGCC